METNSKQTKEEKLEKAKKYRETHRDYYREYMQEYHAQHPRRGCSQKPVSQNRTSDKCTKLVGMQLQDVLKEIPENQIIAIGANSAWVWFGTSNEAESIVQKFEACLEETKNQYRINMEAAENALSEAPRKSALQKAESNKKAIDGYKNPLHREVVDVYPSILDDVLMVKISGFEHGKFWRYREWQRVANM